MRRGRRRPVRPRPSGGELRRRSAATQLRGGAGHAGRPVPVGRVRRAAAPRRLGPRGGHGAGPRREPARWRCCRAAPSPIGACTGSTWTTGRPSRTAARAAVPRRTVRVTGRQQPEAGSAGSPGRRAGRGDGLRDARRRGDPAGRQRLAGHADHPRPRAGGTRPRGSRARSRSGRATAPGRPVELGRELGAFSRRAPRGGAGASEDGRMPSSAWSPNTTWTAGGREPARATWTTEPTPRRLPTDRTIVLERFRDELGDWRVCLLTPFGARVHAPWALAIEARLRERLGVDVQPIWSDDGIVLRLPATEAPRRGRARAWRPDDWPERRRGPRRAATARSVGRSPDEVEEPWSAALGVLGALRQPLPRERGPRAAAAPASGGAQRHAALADAPARGTAAGGGLAATARSRSSSRRTGSASATSSTCPRCAGSSPRSSGARSKSSASRRAARRRSPARCCSTTSPPTCTRAMRRWSTGGPRRWRSTGTCCATCWARRSCASCSTRRARGAGARAAGAARGARGRLRPTRCTTCCAGSATCPAPRWPPGSRARTAAARAAGAESGWRSLEADRRAVQVRIGRRGALDRRRRTRGATATPSASRCRRGMPDDVPGGGARCARGAAPPVGTLARPVHARASPPSAGASPRWRVERALERLLAAWRDPARRVPARRRGARVVRPGGAPAAPAALAGAAAPRDRAGGGGRAGAVPARRGTG